MTSKLTTGRTTCATSLPTELNHVNNSTVMGYRVQKTQKIFNEKYCDTDQCWLPHKTATKLYTTLLNITMNVKNASIIFRLLLNYALLKQTGGVLKNSKNIFQADILYCVNLW